MLRRTLTKWLLLALALSVSGLSHAAITRIGAVTASATTCTFTTHQAGDLLVVWAVRGGSTTAPTQPAGYTTVFTKSNSTATTLAARLGYKIATATNDSSGTWTNASELICAVYRASSGNVLRVAQNASSSSTTTTITYPALSPMGDSTSGNSWVLGVFGASNITQTMGAPTGMTNVTSVQGASYEAALADTNAGVSSWSQQTVTAGTGNSVSGTVEIVLAPISFPLSSYIYQHVGGGGNPASQGASGNAYKLPLPNASGAGNTYVLAITYDGGATISSVSGAVNGSFGSPAVTALGGAGNLDTAVYVFPNISAGQETITVTFGSSTAVFQYCITELYGVATSFTPSAGSTTQKTAFSTTIGSGSFTPPNNNGTGGNFIWSYFVKSDQTPTHLTTQIFPDGNSTLLNADIGWANATDAVVKAVEGYVQTTSAAINPTVVSAADSGDHWNSVSVALKVSSGTGTAPATGIQITKIDHFTSMHFPGSGIWQIQCPAYGNLHAIQTTDTAINTITVWDNEGVTWTSDQANSQFWYRANDSSPNSNLVIYTNGGGGDADLSWRCIDITGAASSPYDTSVNVGATIGNISTYTASPNISPTNSPDLVIAGITLSMGPGLAVTAPTGAIWDLCTYTGEVDGDRIENADILAHYHAAATGAQTWTFTITPITGNGTGAGTIAFKAAAGASCTHQGYTSGGALATPNGTTGSYLGKSGSFVTPNCSSTQYWQPTIGNFNTSDLSSSWLDRRLRAANDDSYMDEAA